MPEPSAFIAELEDRIEQLAEQAGRGRTVEVVAKAVMAAGFLLLAAKLLGLAFASPLT